MISAKPFEGVNGRLIHLTGLFGTLTFSLEDAERAVLELQAACERARDVTPLDKAHSENEQAISRRRQQVREFARTRGLSAEAMLKELGL